MRRLSAQERADVYMGSDMTIDDFEAFSGRVLDFDWKLLGEKDVLSVSDARKPLPTYFGPQSRVPHDRWQVRRCWAVEATPKWKGHPYASKIIFFDKQTMSSPVALAFNREGKLWRIFGVLYHLQAPGTTPQEQIGSGKPSAMPDTLWRSRDPRLSHSSLPGATNPWTSPAIRYARSRAGALSSAMP